MPSGGAWRNASALVDKDEVFHPPGQKASLDIEVGAHIIRRATERTDGYLRLRQFRIRRGAHVVNRDLGPDATVLS